MGGGRVKFHVYGQVTGTKYLGIVEADTEEAAIDLALQNASVHICHQCKKECEDPQIQDAKAEPVE